MKYKILILVVLILFFACKLNSIQSDDSYIDVSHIDNTKIFKGYIKEKPIVNLSFKCDGKINFIPYSKGDYVKRNQILAKLDKIAHVLDDNNFNTNEIDCSMIASPFDGYIQEVYAHKNSYVKTNQRVIAVDKKNKTEAEILVEPEFINRIDLKNKAKLLHKNSEYEATITNIKRSDDNYIVVLELDDSYDELKEGLSITAQLCFNTK